MEDTKLSLADIQKEFNPEIATLVDGVTKLTHLPTLLRADQRTETGKGSSLQHRKFREDEIAETLRKTFLAMSDDIRVGVDQTCGPSSQHAYVILYG